MPHMAINALGAGSMGLLTRLDTAQKKESALCLSPHWGIYRVNDDSMKPSFKEGDFVIVDALQNQINEGFYALNYGDHVSVKRLQLLSCGDVRIISDNPLYEDEVVTKSLIEPSLIGRLIFVEKKLQ